MSTTSGACVSRARLAAAEGMPMPTKHTVPFFRRRAASMVMISVAVYSVVLVSGMFVEDWVPAFAGTTASPPSRDDSLLVCGLRGSDADGFHEFGMILRPHDVLLHPRAERFALARDRVPGLAERVVAAVIAVRVAGMRAVGHVAHGTQHPVRQEARIHRRFEVVDHFLDGGDGRL